MMRFFTPVLAAALLSPAAAHAAECKIEDWKWSSLAPTVLVVEGTTTCKTGEIVLRLYEGEGGAFVGVETAYIQGYAFKTIRKVTAQPSVLAIKYTIE